VKLHKLNQLSWTPANVLASVDVDNVEQLVVVAKMKDGSFDTVATRMTLSTLTCLCMALQRRTFRVMDMTAEEE